MEEDIKTHNNIIKMKNLSKRELFLAGLITEAHYNLDTAPVVKSSANTHSLVKKALAQGLYILKNYNKFVNIQPIEVGSLTESKMPRAEESKSKVMLRSAMASPQFNKLLKQSVQAIHEGLNSMPESDVVKGFERLAESAAVPFIKALKHIVVDNNIGYGLWASKSKKRLNENMELPNFHTNNLSPENISTIANLPSASAVQYQIDTSKLDEVLKMLFFSILIAALSKLMPNFNFSNLKMGQDWDKLASLKTILGPFDMTDTIQIASDIV